MLLQYLARGPYGQLNTFNYGPFSDHLVRAAVVAATDEAVRCALAERLAHTDDMFGVEGLWEIGGEGTDITFRAIPLPLFPVTPRVTPVLEPQL